VMVVMVMMALLGLFRVLMLVAQPSINLPPN